MNEDAFCFLHIGKTGGTALKAMFGAFKATFPTAPIRVFGHNATLTRLTADAPRRRAIFFVRDPLARFVSAFDSRKRMGRPRYNVPWNEAEEETFTRFATASELAEGLSHCPEMAREAMNSIGHIRRTLVYFLGSPAFLEEQAARLAFVGRQECFDEDVLVLRRMLSVPSFIDVPRDEVGAHRSPSGSPPTALTDLAKANLRRWYADDYEILDTCLSIRQRKLTSGIF